MSRAWTDIFRAVGVATCGVVLLAAACEQKKKDPQPGSDAATNGTQTANAVTTGKTTGMDDEIVEEKSPKSVGPEAPAIFGITGLKGYTEPCGCTLDVMLGGIDRIAGYVEAARQLYPAVDFVDSGDLFFQTKTIEEHEIPQEKAKIDLIVQGLKAAKLQATVPGDRDFALGPAFYLEQLAAAGITPIAANLTIDGASLDPTRSVKLGETDVLYVGLVEPALYEGIDGVTTSDPKAALARHADAIKRADVTVLLVHGELPFTKQMLEEAPDADFAFVGHDPRETDQVDEVGQGHTLEPYDQGRYFGILKLFGTDDAEGKALVNAGTGSKAELEKIDRQIEHVNQSLNKIPPPKSGQEPPPIRKNLRDRLERLQTRKQEIKTASVEVPEGKPAFLWRSVPMEPGFPPDPTIAKAKEAYNAKLKDLNNVGREVIPVEPGEAEFIGSNNCASCHSEAFAFWENTEHGSALATLQERNKDFDQKCIGCHVVGYEKPGGSVIGKLEYDAKVSLGTQTVELHKDLRNVGCETCHGPGSLHRGAPVGTDGAPQHIIVDPMTDQCGDCHVPEHSPRFRFDTYVERVTGPGHERTTK